MKTFLSLWRGGPKAGSAALLRRQQWKNKMNGINEWNEINGICFVSSCCGGRRRRASGKPSSPAARQANNSTNQMLAFQLGPHLMVVLAELVCSFSLLFYGCGAQLHFFSRNGGACSATQRKTKEPIASSFGPGPNPTPKKERIEEIKYKIKLNWFIKEKRWDWSEIWWIDWVWRWLQNL